MWNPAVYNGRWQPWGCGGGGGGGNGGCTGQWASHLIYPSVTAAQISTSRPVARPRSVSPPAGVGWPGQAAEVQRCGVREAAGSVKKAGRNPSHRRLVSHPRSLHGVGGWGLRRARGGSAPCCPLAPAPVCTLSFCTTEQEEKWWQIPPRIFRPFPGPIWAPIRRSTVGPIGETGSVAPSAWVLPRPPSSRRGEEG